MTDYSSYADDSATPMHQILSEVSNLEAEAELIAVLRNPASLDNIPTKYRFTINDMMELFESEQSIGSELRDRTNYSITTANGSATLDAQRSLSQAASEAIEVKNDSILQDALRIVEERVEIPKDAMISVPSASQEI